MFCIRDLGAEVNEKLVDLGPSCSVQNRLRGVIQLLEDPLTHARITANKRQKAESLR